MWRVPCGSIAISRNALKTCLMCKMPSRGAKWANLPVRLSFMGILKFIVTGSRRYKLSGAQFKREAGLICFNLASEVQHIWPNGTYGSTVII